ncbi:MAG TPA: alpha/beta hydrolase [Candidatus Eremiobacteraceae bacterium]|nr:alpha/beta hydrolase [Candidatus Eremiobacteraceae bacterium]
MARALSIDTDFVYRPPSGSRPHVVLLPGLVAGRWMWEPTLQALAANGYGFLTLEHPLAGEHDSVEPITHGVIDLMDRCGIASAVMVGGSFGSRIAIDCALKFPKRVDMLALSGAPGSVTTTQLGVGFQGKATRAFCLFLVDKIFYDRRHVDEAEIEAMIRLFRDTRRTVNAMRLMKECSGFDYASALARIDPAVLMIWGAYDQISPCETWQRDLAPSARRGSFFRIERCGHVPMIERPRIFNALLLDRLQPALS